MEKKRNCAWSCYWIAWRKMLMFTKLLRILLFVVYIFLSARGIAQERVVSEKEKSKVLQGWVYDKNHQVLPGVTVKVAGTSIGTSTNVKGWFRITLPMQRGTLEFSFIGFKKQLVNFTDKTDTLRIVLEEDLMELDEVTVSTGYYKVDKRHLTSSVTTLKMDDIMQPGVGTLDQMLEGRIPGMIFMQNSGQVGAVPKMKIRGTTTLLGSTAPLWVLDGVILTDPVNVDPASINDLDFVNLLGNAISGLNPEDIEKLDVLKDASATAIYGPKASNGVIVITTKKGKVGAPSVSYSLSGTFRQRPRYTDRSVDVMNSQERIDFSKEVVRKKQVIPDLSSYVGYEAAYNDYVNGVMSSDEFIRKVKFMETVNTDWLGLLMQDTYSHAHTLSVSGGSENVRYYTSLGYSNENGNLKGEENSRYSAMAKVDINYEKFVMSFNLNGNVQKKEYTPQEVGLMTYALNTARSVGAYNEDGSLMFYQRDNDLRHTYLKPFSIINERKNTSDDIQSNAIGMSANIEYRVIPCLKAGVQFSYGISNFEERVYFGVKSWYAANLRKEYFPGSDNEGVASNSEMPIGGELRLNNTKNENYSVRVNLAFNKFLDKENAHQFQASVIGELSSTLYTGFAITKRGYIPERGMLFDDVNLSDSWGYLEFPNYDGWLKSDASAKGILTHNLTRQVGLVGTLFYGYKDAYIFNANMRIDGSNKFGDTSNEKLNPIWSVSGRWNIHENLLSNKWWINTLALKASFGYQGNMSAQDSPNLIIQRKGTHWAFDELYSSIKYYPNPHLKWERTSTYNIELEYSLFNNKLVGNFSYYYRHTTDAFMSKTVSRINGVSSYTVNRGTLNNQGFEFDINFTPIENLGAGGEKRGFVWRINPNFGSVFNQLVDKIKSKDKVLQDEIRYGDYLDGRVQVAGRPVNTFYSYKFKGLDPKDGRPTFYGTDANEIVGTDKNGNEITRQKSYELMTLGDVCMEVMEHSGCREPFLQGSISNYLGWRNWGLSFNLAYSVGAKIRLLQMYGSNNSAVPAPVMNMRGEFVHRWRRPGDEEFTNVPGLLDAKSYEKTRTPWWNDKPYEFAGTIWNMYDNSNVRVVSGDYLKLTSLSLRYIVPERICHKMYMKSAYLNVSGTNLFTLCSKKLKGQDPSQSGSSELINISVRPTYSLSLNVTF
ncbi:MAG TPA: SusC/RagA family TonB-linked outer membrane protein [Butyricimonas virosa]|jgi:TonB-linked SusC/RagA family outer membrane protein|uniref:SusC/RagA family TonB-linked outer membrane protein n=6 Tax=Butyricimonas virosa TaxID=544645 RepID=A0A921H2N6_9BACT|nr:SusC/RagA family TonB-linked outer membrane protein [Butyricimonas virosa]MCI7163143.1 SusC/RagA family TonB-linked outer membrane protein [Butyricimonas virosa]MDY5011436.1 SusC/RagA family TonB-linked outer membrane protein [Butyricimonas virosa]MDY5534528.1 SusC/RagA family TonB-linked outer membrane protein [Butyricimonas virosa]QRO51436.1 SusC/RagA family TonB-linked outer membrane protein [Butyricimonas virosa]UWO47815.1 SusC/RagA family TonB-linked outer membrane protein [Butyricimon